MLKLCFATNNAHKLSEVQQALGPEIKLVTLQEIGCMDEIDEPFDTIQENSEAKARFIWERYNIDTIADDSGLVIPSLDGEPGVRSARYAGPQRDDKDNIRLVWENLAEKENRNAYFITVITLILAGQTYFFEGIVYGSILAEERGENGFGYDPVFLPDGSDRTFAEMSLREKSELSHRARAVEKLNEFLANKITISNGKVQ